MQRDAHGILAYISFVLSAHADDDENIYNRT